MRCVLGLAAAIGCCHAAEELASCPSEHPGLKEEPVEGKKLNLLQAKSRSLLNLASYSEMVAGVNITLHNAFGTERRPEDKHKWVVTLPKTCSDADVHAFAADMPNGAKSLFLGTPSNTGLSCVLVMEATEAELRDHIKTHPGAEIAQVDLQWEEQHVVLAEVIAAADASGNPEDLPEGEGLPDVPSSLLPVDRRVLPALAEAGSELRALWDFNNRTFAIPGPWGDSDCGGPFSATVYYPSKKHEWVEDTKHPVITVGHGYTQFGHKVAEQLEHGFIRTLVEWGGYVVVAHLSAEGWCDTAPDMLYVLDWIKGEDSPFLDIIQPDRTAAVGYSMGGKSALTIGHSESDTQRHNIKAVAAIMPPCRSGCPVSRVPAYYGAGTKDTLIPYKVVERAFEEAAGVDKVFVNICGAPHWEVGVWGKNRHMTSLLEFLGCHLWDTAKMCDKVYRSWPGNTSLVELQRLPPW